MLALMFISLLGHWTGIIALATPPFVLALWVYRGKPPWKLTLVFLIVVLFCCWGIFQEFGRYHSFLLLCRAQGYQDEVKPWGYLPDWLLEEVMRGTLLKVQISTTLTLATWLAWQVIKRCRNPSTSEPQSTS